MDREITESCTYTTNMISLNNALNNLENETYSSDSEDDEYNPYISQVIDGIDDKCNIEFNDGYESDTSDTYKQELDLIESTVNLSQYKTELYTEANVDPNTIQKILSAEWEAYRQKEIATKVAQKAKLFRRYEIEKQNLPSIEPDYTNEILETLPHKDVIDNKIYSQSKIDAMRDNKYYKLANIFSVNFYMSSEYPKLIFAFKNDTTIDDNQCIFMLRDILSNKFNTWADADEDNLIMTISRKTYPNYYDKDLLRSKWIHIQKIAKELHPIDYMDWTKENESIVRKAKVLASDLAKKEKHSVYRFLNQYKESGQIKASVFYEQYVAFCGNDVSILVKLSFGKLLNKHGINTKRTYKDGKCYLISSGSIELWKSNFII